MLRLMSRGLGVEPPADVTVPGSIGGGRIKHGFFAIQCESDVEYASVGDFERHQPGLSSSFPCPPHLSKLKLM